jgi:hypothetical protein
MKCEPKSGARYLNVNQSTTLRKGVSLAVQYPPIDSQTPYRNAIESRAKVRCLPFRLVWIARPK